MDILDLIVYDVKHCRQQRCSMTRDEAVRHFGGVKKLAAALDVWPQVIYAWGDTIPMARQYELEVRTDGNLRADRPGDKQ
jgi:hypothetical protein